MADYLVKQNRVAQQRASLMLIRHTMTTSLGAFRRNPRNIHFACFRRRKRAGNILEGLVFRLRDKQDDEQEEEEQQHDEHDERVLI